MFYCISQLTYDRKLEVEKLIKELKEKMEEDQKKLKEHQRTLKELKDEAKINFAYHHKKHKFDEDEKKNA